jgi:hypothetical protein
LLDVLSSEEALSELALTNFYWAKILQYFFWILPKKFKIVIVSRSLLNLGLNLFLELLDEKVVGG